MDKPDSAGEGISLLLLNQYSAPPLLARNLAGASGSLHRGCNFFEQSGHRRLVVSLQIAGRRHT